MTVLGWGSLVLIALGLSAIALGYWDMDRQTVADGKMGGAIFAMLGMVIGGLGVLLGVIWLIVK